jgi:hypothetical protein
MLINHQSLILTFSLSIWVASVFGTPWTRDVGCLPYHSTGTDVFPSRQVCSLVLGRSYPESQSEIRL